MGHNVRFWAENEARAPDPLLITASLGVTSNRALQVESGAGRLQIQVIFTFDVTFNCIALHSIR